MKLVYSMLLRRINHLIILISLSVFFVIPNILSAQSFCATTKAHESSGYSTVIESVSINDQNAYDIVLKVSHNGCSDSQCKALNQYSVEADEGTYFNISYVTIYGNMTSNGINMGPNLGGTPFDGFRIASISGIGNGQAGVFHILYTLSYLQDQQVQIKASGFSDIVMFSEQEFQDVLNCNLGGSYVMPEGGKIDDISNKLGPELTALSNYTGVPLTDDVYEIIHDASSNIFYVVVEFIPVEGQYSALLNILQNNYGLIEGIGNGQSVITGQIPINQLQFLNTLSELSYARPVYPATTNVGLLATSQGDTSMVSNIARNIFFVNNENSKRYINGEGIKIGVLSNSYNTKQDPPNQANDDVLKFELPGIGIKPDGTTVSNPINNTDVITIKEYPYGEASDEGRAMLQIIHDIAPGADLYFRTGVLGAVDMAVGIDELVNAGCDLIVDDITYITQPFFEDGDLAQKVDNVSSNGVSYFTSAGNFGSKSYTGTFSPSSNTINGITGTPHIFGYDNGAEDIYQSVTMDLSSTPNPPAHYTIVLQWDDGSSYDSTATDLDIYISNEDYSGFIGYNTINTGGRAIEVLPFVVTETTLANIVVVKASGNNTPVTFKYVVFKGQLLINEYGSGNSTIVGHANASEAMTVGAIRYDKTPAYGGVLDIMSYSSVGGLLVDGNNRFKPDFTAPNGVNTTVDLGNGDWDHLTDPEADMDTHPNFFGTSAAAPHAAAVAALIMDARKSFYGDILTPSEVRNTLISSAIGSGSYDNVYGNGFVQADAALQTLANPSPILHEIVNITGNPGVEEVFITVSASYLTSATKLYFNGTELPTTVDTIAGILNATVPAFSELYPPLNAYNPPKTGTNGKDGGMSNTLYFSEKPTIVGNLYDQSKTYGEDMPTVSTNYEVINLDGTTKSLTEAGLTASQITRVESISMLNNASALANAGIWPYYVDPYDVLNPLYVPSNPPVTLTDDESFLLDNYKFSFNIGELEIAKLELTITPDDRNIYFGEPVVDLTYTFSYDSSNISQGPNGNNQIIQDSLYLAYHGDLIEDRTALVDSAFYMADSSGGLVANSYYMSADAYQNGLALALVNGKALALVNGKALALVNGQALALVNNIDSLAAVNGKALALVNGKALALVNKQALALVNTEHLTNGLALALVNRQALALVNTELETEAFVNGKALALVNRDVITNKQALALVNTGQNQGLINKQALALVNSTTMNEVSNTDAVIILTVDDIKVMESGTPLDEIELISVNTISGNTATVNSEPHKIAPGAFNASNFNVQYGLGNLSIDPAPVSFSFDHNTAVYDGSSHEVVVSPTYPEYMTIPPDSPPYMVSYIDENGVESITGPINAGTYLVKITFTDQNFTFYDPNNPDFSTLTIYPAPVAFQFMETTQVYSGAGIGVEVVSIVTAGAAPVPSEFADYLVTYNGVSDLPVNAGSYDLDITITNTNYTVDEIIPSNPVLTIEQAPVIFNFWNTEQTYNGEFLTPDNSAIISIGDANPPNEGVDYIITYDSTPNPPQNAGSYSLDVIISNLNYKFESFIPTEPEFTINPAQVSFDFNDTIQTYNGTQLSITVTLTYDPLNTPPPLTGYEVLYSFDNGTTFQNTRPSDAGSYPVKLIITDPNYIDANGSGSSETTLVINPSPVSFEFSNESTVYTGTGQSVGVTASSYPAGVTYDVKYSSDGGNTYSLNLPINAGNYPVRVIVTNPNYSDANGNGVSETTFIIAPAPVVFTFSGSTVIYNGVGQEIVVDAVTNPEGVTYDVSYSFDGGSTFTADLPVNTGDYPVQVTIADPNYTDSNGQGVSYSVFSIDPETVFFTYSGTSLIYNGYQQEITVNTQPTVSSLQIWYSTENTTTTSPPVNSGDYIISIEVTDNNYIADAATSTSTFSILKSYLSVFGNNQVINEGDSLPPFTFSYSGFMAADNEVTVFGAAGPNYTVPYTQGSSGPGAYTVSFPDTENYNIIFPEPINLYVNPDGPGTKSVVPKLDCVTDQGDGTFIAHFEYDNKNNVPVWVLIGPDNIVTGGGPDPDISQQPIKFESGGGTWTATFDGSPMTWHVSSQHHGHKTSHAQSASSNSKNCNKQQAIDMNNSADDVIFYYPNPVKNKINVYAESSSLIKQIQVMNIMGAHIDVESRMLKENMYELDMSNEVSGFYIIKIFTDTYYKTIRIIKY